jgi:hypothetical protein
MYRYEEIGLSLATDGDEKSFIINEYSSGMELKMKGDEMVN